MNFNIYVPKRLGKKLEEATKALRCKKNSIITEALEEWLSKHFPTKWPKDFFDFEPIEDEDLPDFKALRKDLKNNIKEDPLA